MATRARIVEAGRKPFSVPAINSGLCSEQMTETQFDRMIHHEAGLLGVSEISSDMRDLLAREAADERGGRWDYTPWHTRPPQRNMNIKTRAVIDPTEFCKILASR